MAGLTGCGGPRRAQDAFDHARQTFIHGELETSQQEAHSGYQRFSGLSPGWAWKFRVLEAQSLLWQGNYPEVLKLLDAPIPESVPPETTVSILTLRGIAHGRKLDLRTATRELEEAQRLCGQLSPASCGEVFQGSGLVALGQNHFSKAQLLFEQALSTARIAGDRLLETTSLLNMVASLVKEGRFDEAIDRSGPAIEAATNLEAKDVEVAIEENLGWAYYRLGDSERASQSLLEAEKRAHQLRDYFGEENALTNMGYIQMDAHEFDLAERTFQQALARATKEESQEHIYNVLRGLARAAMQNDDPISASQYAQRALDLAKQSENPLDELDPILVQGQVSARQGDAAGAEEKFHRVEQTPKVPSSLKWEAQHFLARLYEQERPPQLADREYRAALSTFESARDSETHPDFQLSFFTNASRIYDDYVHFLVNQGKTAEALRWADYSRARSLAEGLGWLSGPKSLGPPPLDASRAAARLRSTILFYWLGERSSYVWAVTPTQVRVFPLAPSAQIEALVERYSRALSPQAVSGSAETDGSSLYQMLVQPVSKLLPAGGKVVIVPDGKLNNLNFETLLVSEPELHYWIEDVTLANASSLRLLTVKHKAKAGNSRSLLLLGNVISPSPEFPELAKSAPGTGVEKYFARQKLLQLDQATASAYLTGHPEQYSHIHFDAHAIASQSSPLESAIILSRDSNDSNRYKLYAHHIIQHPLRADLVTISACNSAGARTYRGEGLVGLSWAFLRAGAHNVVAALWEVSDPSSGPLMDEFYNRMSKGEKTDSALRAAKLSLLQSHSAFRKPFYWGAFQLYVGS